MTSRLIAAGALWAAACTPEAMTIDQYPCPPQGTTLTYESFGRPFLDAWCMRCHDDGPNGIYFRDQEEVAARRARIFVNAAATNTFMPPGPDDPAPEERDLLAEWLACGAP